MIKCGKTEKPAWKMRITENSKFQVKERRDRVKNIDISLRNKGKHFVL